MSSKFKCDSCDKVVDAVRTSGDASEPPRAWCIIRISIEELTDDDGSRVKSESDDFHMCQDCSKNFDADDLAKRAIPIKWEHPA